MVILLSLLELEGQTPSSLEDMPGPPQQLLTKERRKMAMVTLPISLGIGRADLLFFRRYAMTTSAALD